MSSLISLFLSNLVKSYNASQPLNLTQWPEGLATQLSITEFTAGILLSGLLLMVPLLPVLYWSRKGIYPTIFIGMIFSGFFIAVGWLPTYFLLIITIFIGVLLAGASRKWIAG